MTIDFALILPVLLEWWPFVAVVFLLWYIGQEVKKMAPAADESPIWKLYRKTLPFHPVMAGIMLGFIPGFPVPATINALGALAPNLYYAFAGFASVFWHDCYQTWRKHSEKKDE